jgi:ABC-type Mn2+/Zn2+ transport system permease subunit
VTTPDNTPYGLIIGVSIGGAVLVAGLVVLIVYLARRAAVAQPSVRLDAPVRIVFSFLFSFGVLLTRWV